MALPNIPKAGSPDWWRLQFEKRAIRTGLQPEAKIAADLRLNSLSSFGKVDILSRQDAFVVNLQCRLMDLMDQPDVDVVGMDDFAHPVREIPLARTASYAMIPFARMRVHIHCPVSIPTPGVFLRRLALVMKEDVYPKAEELEFDVDEWPLNELEIVRLAWVMGDDSWYPTFQTARIRTVTR